MKLSRLVDAAVEPVSLADMKSFLRLENSADDALVADLISAARRVCEQVADRSLIATTWQVVLDFLPFSTPGGALGPALVGFPYRSPGRVPPDDGGIVLPMPPLISLASLTYVDAGGTARTLDPSAVIVSPGTPGRIYPAYGTFFPFAQPRPAAVAITYTAGFGADAAAVPRNLVQAVRMLAAHYYQHRTEDAPIPEAVAHLIGPSKWGAYA